MDWKTSKYKKTIGITEINLVWIDKHKKKKSKAGFLDKIINTYKYEGKKQK